jgi:hypothetical protein
MGSVEGLSIRLHGRDTTKDFLRLLGMSSPILDLPRKHPGMSRDLIRLYLAIPGLRTPDSSKFDILLSPLLNESPTPWAISPDTAKQVVNLCRDANIELLTYLSHDERHQMMEDRRWWSAESYDVAEEDVEPLKLCDAISILSKMPQFASLLRETLPSDFELGHPNANPALSNAVKIAVTRCLKNAKKALKAHPAHLIAASLWFTQVQIIFCGMMVCSHFSFVT